MAPKLLWMTIIHVLLWNFIFSVSESVELNEGKDALLNNLHNRVRFTTHICKHLKNVESNLVPEHKTYNEPLSDPNDGFKNPIIDQSELLTPIKRHFTRCFNHAQENNEPHKPDQTSSEWQKKSIPVNNAYDYSVDQNSKVNDKKKIDINLHTVIYQEPLAPLLQAGNLIGVNQKHPLFELNLQDKTNKIKSLISTRPQRPVKIIPNQLLEENLHDKPVQRPLNHPLPSKLSPFIRPIEVNDNANTAFLMKDNDKQNNPLKLSPMLPQIPFKNVYPQDSMIEKKPWLPTAHVNNQKPVEISYDKHVPPFAYRPEPPQFIKTPILKPILVPIFVQKDVSKYSMSERPQANIASSQTPQIVNNGIVESTPQPIIFEKQVSISLPYKEPQTINLSPSTAKPTDTETVPKPIPNEKEVSISATNGQNQPIIDQYKESISQPIPGQIKVSENVPFEQPQAINSYLSPPKIIEISNSESTSQIIPVEKRVPLSEPYEKQRPIVDFSPLPQLPPLQQIKIQKVISIPFVAKQPVKGLTAPPKLLKTFNTELLSQPIFQEKKNAFYESNDQSKLILPSPPPLTKTTTSVY